MNQKLVRIIAIVLAVAIVGSVFIAAITSAVALDAGTAVLATPATGEDTPVIPIVIGVVAVLLVTACVLIPKFAKK